MPTTLFLVGAANHKAGVHRIHAPALTAEGKPLKRSEVEEGAPIVRTVEFLNGKATLDDAGLVRWLKENGHAAEVEVPAFGLMQPGKPAKVEFDEGGNPTVVEPAEPMSLPGVKPEAKK